eukprot:m.56375 g.56375  ORF g.56375 m.56375 type:complete len:66 (+) comp11190_c0_seq4:663-860(+)
MICSFTSRQCPQPCQDKHHFNSDKKATVMIIWNSFSALVLFTTKKRLHIICTAALTVVTCAKSSH